MEPRLQAKLLRAIQEREIDRVGGTRAGPGRHPPDRDQQPRPGAGRGRGRVPRGSAVPAQRADPAAAAPARAAGRHRRRWRAISPPSSPRPTACPQRPLSAAALARLQGAALARQRPRARELHPPRGRAGARRRRSSPTTSSPARPTRSRAAPAGARRPGRPHRGRGRAAADRRHAAPHAGQPHPCGDHPRHLDPHAAQQAARVWRRRHHRAAGRCAGERAA